VTALKALERSAALEVEVDGCGAEATPMPRRFGAAKGRGEDVSALIAKGRESHLPASARRKQPLAAVQAELEH